MLCRDQILLAAACTTKDGTVCCTYLGKGGAGNYVKMIHNGIEYGDMQLIAEAYDILKHVVGLRYLSFCCVLLCTLLRCHA